MFNLTAAPVIRCPHCGKAYPRANAASNRLHNYTVILQTIGSFRCKMQMLKLLRDQRRIPLRDARELLNHLPLVLGTGLSEKTASEWKAMIESLDGTARIIRTCHKVSTGAFVSDG